MPQWRLIVTGGSLQVQRRLDDALGMFQSFEIMTTILWLGQDGETLRLPENFLLRHRTDPTDPFGRYTLMTLMAADTVPPTLEWRLGAEDEYLVFQRPDPANSGGYQVMFRVAKLAKANV